MASRRVVLQLVKFDGKKKSGEGRSFSNIETFTINIPTRTVGDPDFTTRKFTEMEQERVRVADRSGVTGMILMWIPTRNPAGGLGGGGGGAVSPRKILKFMVSFTSEDLFWQILENFLGVLLQKYSASERPVCNM